MSVVLLYPAPYTLSQSAWTHVDFYIAIIGMLDFIPTGAGAGDVSALRSLRALRPLRAVHRPLISRVPSTRPHKSCEHFFRIKKI